uniref:Reverse transcriptase zinc-binding domain-containing protein n=1 Tax=Oryza sativa subsp. japonica TaxID=39947 RepID=Q6ESK9_ORYSJ|nr:hypothetical protein [Oryza sativa Japonica Group]
MVSALALVIRAATDLQLTHHHPSSSSAAAHAHPRRWGARRPATRRWRAWRLAARRWASERPAARRVVPALHRWGVGAASLELWETGIDQFVGVDGVLMFSINKSKLIKRKWQGGDEFCKLCGKIESTDHALFKCPLAVFTWCVRWCIMLKEGDQAAMKGWGDLLMAKLQRLKPCCLPASV